MSLTDLEWPSCSLCGGGSFETALAGCRERLLGLPGSFDLQRCGRCGLVQTRPRPTAQALSDYYPPEYSTMFDVPPGTPSRGLRGLLREAFELPRRLRARRFERIPAARPGEAHLEIGCGIGRSFAELHALGWEVWGIEPSAAAAAQATESLKGAGAVLTGRAEEVELPRAGFERISANHVVEHLSDPALVLRRARGWIAPRGTLVLACPNFDCLERRIFGRFWLGLDVPRHLYHFTPRTLGQMLRQTGWRVRTVTAEPVGFTLIGTAALLLDGARGGHREWRDDARVRRTLELADHIGYLLGAKPTMLVHAEPA